ncbi:hypothetical protein, partial [Algoriphagus terrigena]|uniref:hypothetical protein n=1 Tax=Algoriphagus terrigena TaxID=344884 RepID=UPI001B7FCC3A
LQRRWYWGYTRESRSPPHYSKPFQTTERVFCVYGYPVFSLLEVWSNGKFNSLKLPNFTD